MTVVSGLLLTYFPRLAARTGVNFVPRRTITSTPIRCAAKDDEKKSTGLLASMKNMFLGGDSKKTKVTHRPSAPKKEEGGLGNSIFGSDFTSPTSGPKPSRGTPEQEAAMDAPSGKLVDRDHHRVLAGLGPDPKAQLRWERKMAVREIRKRGRLPPKVQIKRTERESLSKSHWIKTSLKKLGPLARQIAGKNIDEAILQMRFSNKKAAKDVLEHLEHAKNVAIVRAGMGLDKSDPTKPINVVLKSGERKKITNPSDIYIQEAWVNRGPYGYEMDHRARGQINRMRPPTTSISVLLKEEKTRIREWEARDAKAQRERVSQLWTQLPDRKIPTQNQYYSW
jgi:ribosomal protein L22